MSIEGCIYIEESEEVIDVGIIEPGSYMSIQDYSSNALITIRCRPDDLGGEIHYPENSYQEALLRGERVHEAAFNKQTQTATIQYGQHYEREIMSKHGIRGHLILIHLGAVLDHA